METEGSFIPDPSATTPTVTEGQDGSAPEASEEVTLPGDETPSGSVADQLASLDLNGSAAQGTSSSAEEAGESAEEEADDGGGEWISSFATP
jgi:hypothetical protein